METKRYRSLASFLFKFIKQDRLTFFAMVLPMIVVIAQVLPSYLVKILVDRITTFEGDRGAIFREVLGPLIGLGICWIAFESSQRIHFHVAAKFFPRFRRAIRTALFKYTQHHSYEYFSSNMSGTLASKIADLPNGAEELLRHIVNQFLPSILSLVVTIFLLFSSYPLLGVVFFIWIVTHLTTAIIYTRRGQIKAEEHAEASSILSGKIVDALTNHMNVRLFANEHFEEQYLSYYQDKEQRKLEETAQYFNNLAVFFSMAMVIMLIIMFVISIFAWAHNKITIGDFSLVTGVLIGSVGHVWNMGYAFGNFFRIWGNCKNALNILNVPYGVRDVADAKELEVIKGEIQFKHVYFSFDKRNPLFTNLNLKIESGERLGIVGFSGSGKSTLINLLLRHFDVDQGTILIDAQNIVQVTQESLRRQIAVVPQNSVLFDRTLMENIRYGCINATDKEVIEASIKAHCHEFIERMPFGYQTRAGERGIKLSGGQVQRIAIARAILKNAPILLLDEASSALDSNTEKLIQESLKLLMEHRTVITVAHRLSTLSEMHRIIVLKQGQIVEEGTHHELIQKKSFYAELWKLQHDGVLP